MSRDLHGLFSPKSVAVIGASKSPEKVGAIAVKNIIDSGFKGTLYPVNPNEAEIAGMKCYPDVNSLPEVPDLAVFAIPSAVAIGVLEEIGKKGIKNAVIFSAGFKEIGGEGELLEKQLVDTANKYQINVLGPNCLGFANNYLPINVTFGQVVKEPGNLRIVSQSGAIAASLFDWCQTIKLGFSEFITIGNKSVVTENDILEYWLQNHIPIIEDPRLSKVSPIGLYLESIAGGADFVKIATEISKTTPIFALKPGKSKAAAQAMHSHTGAIAGEDSVLDVAFKQSGIIRCSDLNDFFNVARALAWENVPKGPNVAVVSNAGGPAVLSTDAIADSGLKMAEFSPDTHQKLAAFLPRMASFLNPVDVLGDALADRFGQALEAILQEPTVDAAIVILTPQLMTQIEKTAEIIGNLSSKYNQPILCSFIGGSLTAEGERTLNDLKIPSFPFPEQAIRTLSLMWQWKNWRANQTQTSSTPELPLEQNIDTVKNILSSARNNFQKNLDNFAANDVVSSSGITCPPTMPVSNIEEAEQFASGSGWPMVLKVSSAGLLHKADIGGVITHIHNIDELKIAWAKLSQQIDILDPEIKKNVKIQIQKEIAGGVEIIVGVKRDPNFGPVILFGAGGKYAELLVDRNLHLLPITHEQAQKLVENSKIVKLLKGYRGDQPYNLDPLYETIVRLGKLAESVSDISEIEINPLIITHNGTWAVDCKVVLTQLSTPTFTIPQFKTATTISHKLVADKYHHFLFESATPLNFKAGQFVSVKVNDQRINAYSIAGCPDQNHFELLVDVSPQGVGSKYFENLKEGEKITYLGPAGIFTLKPNDGSQHLLLLGTGSGIAPLKYMAEDALKNLKITQPITLYFGLRFKEDIFWTDIFDELSRNYPNFHYKLCLSKPSPDWTGFSGHITDIVKQDFPDAGICSAYLCGNKAMIEESAKLLLESGCPQERIYSEKFY